MINVMKAKIELLDEDMKPVTCIIKGCNNMPKNVAFGVLCKHHMQIENFKWATFRSRGGRVG